MRQANCDEKHFFAILGADKTGSWTYIFSHKAYFLQATDDVVPPIVGDRADKESDDKAKTNAVRIVARCHWLEKHDNSMLCDSKLTTGNEVITKSKMVNLKWPSS